MELVPLVWHDVIWFYKHAQHENVLEFGSGIAGGCGFGNRENLFLNEWTQKQAKWWRQRDLLSHGKILGGCKVSMVACGWGRGCGCGIDGSHPYEGNYGVSGIRVEKAVSQELWTTSSGMLTEEENVHSEEGGRVHCHLCFVMTHNSQEMRDY